MARRARNHSNAADTNSAFILQTDDNLFDCLDASQAATPDDAGPFMACMVSFDVDAFDQADLWDPLPSSVLSSPCSVLQSPVEAPDTDGDPVLVGDGHTPVKHVDETGDEGGLQVGNVVDSINALNFQKFSRSSFKKTLRLRDFILQSDASVFPVPSVINKLSAPVLSIVNDISDKFNSATNSVSSQSMETSPLEDSKIALISSSPACPPMSPSSWPGVWFFDSAASAHLCGGFPPMFNYRRARAVGHSLNLAVGDAAVAGFGSLDISIDAVPRPFRLRLQNVLHVPSAKVNLLSVCKLADIRGADISMSFDSLRARVVLNGYTFEAIRERGMYVLPVTLVSPRSVQPSTPSAQLQGCVLFPRYLLLMLHLHLLVFLFHLLLVFTVVLPVFLVNLQICLLVSWTFLPFLEFCLRLPFCCLVLLLHLLLRLRLRWTYLQFPVPSPQHFPPFSSRFWRRVKRTILATNPVSTASVLALSPLLRLRGCV